MRRNRTKRRILGAALLLLPLVAAGCGGEEEAPGAGTPSVDAALVPGADFVLRVDVEALQGAPIYAALRSEDGDADGESESEAGEAPDGPGDFDAARFLEVTGLTPEDLVSVLVSADVDSVDPEAGAPTDNLEQVAGVAGMLLKRPLSLDTLEQALKESARGDTPPAIGRVDVAGTPALRLESTDPDEPDIFLAAGAGDRAWFMAPNQASLEGALQRAASGEAAPVGAEIEQVRAALPSGAQARLAFLLPEKLRARLQEEGEGGGDPMTAGVMAPFRKLRSLALSVEAGEELGVVLAGDLADAAAASQAGGLLSGMVVPMAHGAMAEATGSSPQEMADRLTVTNEGSMLRIVLRVTASDAAAYRREAEEKAAEMSAQ